MLETRFQKAIRQYDDWEALGRQGKPPARVAFHHADVTALVDPFRKLPGTIVVIPKESNPGGEHHFANLPSTRRMQISLICQEFGKNILETTGVRAVEHVEGYGVADHAHTVIFPAGKHEGAALYEGVALPEQPILDLELDSTLEYFGIISVQAEILRRKLDIVDGLSPIFDGSLQLGTVNGLGDLLDRVILDT